MQPGSQPAGGLAPQPIAPGRPTPALIAQRIAGIFKRGAQPLAIIDQRGILVIVAQHGQDHDLPRGEARRNAQTVIIAMRHDHAADHPRRDAPAGCVGQRLAAFAVLEFDPARRRKIRAEIMAGPGLERLAVLHHRFDRPSLDSAGETLVLRLLARDHGERQILFGALPIDFEHAQGVLFRLRLGLVSGVALLPEKFGRAQEHPRAHFPAHDIGPLVEL